MWLREVDGKVMSVGAHVDHFTNGARAPLLGGGLTTLGQIIDTGLSGLEEECQQLLYAVMLGRRLAAAVIALDGERLDLAYELLEETECWDEGGGPTLADAMALAIRKGITIETAGELIKGRTAYPPLYAL